MNGQSVAGPEIGRLIQLLSKLPGLGPRSARRAALHLIKKKEQLLVPLTQAMESAVDCIGSCTICGNIGTNNPCTICTDNTRNSSVIVVVEDVSELWALGTCFGDKSTLSCSRWNFVVVGWSWA